MALTSILPLVRVSFWAACDSAGTSERGLGRGCVRFSVVFVWESVRSWLQAAIGTLVLSLEWTWEVSVACCYRWITVVHCFVGVSIAACRIYFSYLPSRLVSIFTWFLWSFDKCTCGNAPLHFLDCEPKNVESYGMYVIGESIWVRVSDLMRLCRQGS